MIRAHAAITRAAVMIPLTAALLLSACDAGSRAGIPDADSITIDSSTLTVSPPASVTALIRPDGIAEARRGMTIGDLRAALPAGTILGSPKAFMVDISAMSVVRGRDTLYYVLIPGGEPSSDDTPINVVGTMNPAYRTAEGAGPGTTLLEAARIYGPPRLTYNTNDESREYAHFPNVPENIHMRVTSSLEDGAFAGIYQTGGEYNETTEYDPAAVIAFVMVGLHSMTDDGDQ